MQRRRADARKYHYIYKITRFDGKFYVGMHSTDDMDDGYFGSGKIITRSINKHGVQKHRKEILEYLPTRKMLVEREKMLVTHDLLNDPLCMNLMLGGHGGWAGNEKSLEALRDPDLKQRSVAASHIAVAQRREEDPEYDAQYREKRRQRMLGKQVFLGKTHSEETKQKMRKSKNAKELNSQFGTCWITDGVKNLKIPLSELDVMPDGFRRGRVVKK